METSRYYRNTTRNDRFCDSQGACLDTLRDGKESAWREESLKMGT